ncbi:Maf family protein [Planomicrobium sp. Y74]|uniref:Maf family protein n=1 Tax=Planomicrobium sp. Y74 TaxID=2478977 RepID=UPI000EF4C55C|nr:Maf family protein [Planomicrobium sp. Y74]RLQ91991.1 septum formation protein Maf [Planomicrobium sp. Y74]
MYFKAQQPVILASQSPRRSELLEMLGFDFRVIPSKKEEPKPEQFQNALNYVLNCAEVKAADVAINNPDAVVIGSDTVVVCDGEILLKPEDKKQAMEYLHKLSGRSHKVITAVSVKAGNSGVQFHETTEVTFFDLPDSWIESYTNTDDPYDKAGAYGIQTLSGLFVEKINGDYNTVVGLPIARLARKLSDAGWISLSGSRVEC